MCVSGFGVFVVHPASRLCLVWCSVLYECLPVLSSLIYFFCFVPSLMLYSVCFPSHFVSCFFHPSSLGCHCFVCGLDQVLASFGKKALFVSFISPSLLCLLRCCNVNDQCHVLSPSLSCFLSCSRSFTWSNNTSIGQRFSCHIHFIVIK